MKNNAIVFILALSCLCLPSCNKEGVGSVGAATGDATHISCRNAVVAGRASLPSSTSADLKFGVLYGTSSGVLFGSSTAVEAKVFDASYNFSITLGVLEPETTYYYRTYVSQGGEVTYGDTKSFTTTSVGTMLQILDPVDVDASVATLKAHLDLTDCVFSSVEYGFVLRPEGGVEYRLAAGNQNAGDYSLKATNLERNKKHEVSAYVSLDGRMYVSSKKSFSTQTVRATVKLNEASGVTEHNATLFGQVKTESEGSYDISADIYYGSAYDSAEALIQNGAHQSIKAGADGVFSAPLTELAAGIKYYCVVVGRVDGQAFTSNVVSFTTTDFAVSFSSIAADASEHTATLRAWVTIQSQEQLQAETWFLYSDSVSDVSSLLSSGKKASAELHSDGDYRVTVTGLTADTEYHAIAVAKVAEKQIHSDVLTISTEGIKIQAYLLGNPTVTEKSLGIRGKLVSNMQEPLENFTQSYKLCYSPTLTTAKDIAASGESVVFSLGDDLAFTASLDDLASDKTYNCVAVATIDGVQILSDVRQYTTAKIQASASTGDAQDVKYSKASVSGQFTLTATADLTTQAYFLFSASASTLEALEASGTKAEAVITGETFATVLQNIQDGATFHYVACFKVHDTVFYGAVKSFTTPAVPQGGVDLGLSVVWAKCNIGAASEEEYGDYYAWGETETKETYTFKTYKWRDFNSAWQYTKYNTKSQLGIVDNKTVLDAEDDVAHVKLGGGWHIPSVADFKELYENCTWEWITINGKKGRRATSKINGKSIFLPAAGYKGEQGLDYQNNWGFYSSCQLYLDYPESQKALHITDHEINPDSSMGRDTGIPVRAVTY